MVVSAACLKIVKTCEHRSVVNHCVPVRHTFNILDRYRRIYKKGNKDGSKKETVMDGNQDSPFLRQKTEAIFGTE